MTKKIDLDKLTDQMKSLKKIARQRHAERHHELHRSLAELVADWIDHTKSLPSKNTVFELMQWSSGQISSPSKKEENVPQT